MARGQSGEVMFDGRSYAKVLSAELKNRISILQEKLGRKLKLVTIYNPEDKAGRIYTDIKEKKAGELGVEFEKIQNSKYTNLQIKFKIQKLNEDKNTDGVMIQMPLGTENDKFLIDLIDLKKDVDGMRQESGVIPATVRAILEILNSKSEDSNKFIINKQKSKILVVGNKGLVGSAIERFMIRDSRFENSEITGMDKDDFDPGRIYRADVIISATGVPGLIKPEMVKPGVVCVDVGYPAGDFDPGVRQKAGFFTPVPGGVGPMTVVMLFTNLADLAEYDL